MPKRNVLLTTLSTIHGDQPNYYYHEDKKGKIKYCTGVASVEPGTKYYLSGNNEIDEIIVIGSKETFKIKEEPELAGKVMSLADLHDCITNKITSGNYSKSDFDTYSENIYIFVSGKEENLNVQNNIVQRFRLKNEIRKAELQNFTQNFVRDHSDQGILLKDYFKFINKYQSGRGFQELRKGLEQNLKDKFVSASDYEQYTGHYEYQEFINLNTVNEQISIIENLLKQTELKQNNISQLESESYRAQLSEYLDRCRLVLEQKKLKEKTDIYLPVINRLKEGVRRLISEIDTLKTNRLKNELEYIKYYLYVNSNPAEKMKSNRTAEDLQIRFIPDRKILNGEFSRTDNIQNLVDAMHTTNTPDTQINVYLDVQGGSRTDSYVRNAVLSILNNESDSNFHLKKVIGINYERNNFANSISDETLRYRITDLVSGMNTFIQYGRVDLLKKYIDETELHEADFLVDPMKQIDNALSMCDIDSLTDAIREMRNAINKPMIKSENTDKQNQLEIITLMKEYIIKDYGALLQSDTIDYLELCNWAFKKQFIQQTLTIIESKFPEQMIKDHIYYYKHSSRQKEQFERAIADRPKLHQWQTEDPDHFFIRYYAKDYKQTHYGLDGKQDGMYIPVYSDCSNHNYVIELLSLYIKLSDMRNDTNHASSKEQSSGNSKTVLSTTTNNIQQFLGVYAKARSCTKSQTSVSVRNKTSNTGTQSDKTTANDSKEQNKDYKTWRIFYMIKLIGKKNLRNKIVELENQMLQFDTTSSGAYSPQNLNTYNDNNPKLNSPSAQKFADYLLKELAKFTAEKQNVVVVLTENELNLTPDFSKRLRKSAGKIYTIKLNGTSWSDLKKVK